MIFQKLKLACFTWDIDNSIEKWNATLQTILELPSILESNDVKNLFY
ncbi:MAG: hypothetical protein QXL69_05260 [Candidatus Bathyarchaeia archaeon]|nr:hypothetical protein [Candidatus Bathyarchaeota archaeon]